MDIREAHETPALQEQYCETVSTIARLSGCASAEIVRLYADLKLIECIRTDSGLRLFRPSAALKVREIYRERLARRGRPRKVAQVAD
jgi:hypothetical protein